MSALLVMLAASWPHCYLLPSHPVFGESVFGSPTLRQEAQAAKAVFVGQLTATRFMGDETRGLADFTVKEVLRGHPVLKGKKVVTIPRHLPHVGQSYLLYCDVAKGEIDAYRGIPLSSPQAVEYARKAMAMKEADLVFFFHHLDSKDAEVAKDARYELMGAKASSLVKAGPKLDASKLRKWLKNPKTPGQRMSLYAFLLGTCGRRADVKLLRALLDSKEERCQAAATGLFVSCVLLDGTAGVAGLKRTLEGADLLPRIHALIAVRFLHEELPGRVAKGRLAALVQPSLKREDVADLAIEILRSMKAWSAAPEVLAVAEKKWGSAPLLKRSVLRYCLQCQGVPQAKAHVDKMRKSDPGRVAEVEEALKLEARTAKP